MSADDKDTACSSEKEVNFDKFEEASSDILCDETGVEKTKKPSRKVSFPDEDHIVTQYFEPANPWQDVPTTTRAQLAAEYLECCRRHNTPPIETVLQQIRELPENAIGGAVRAPRLTLSDCLLLGSAPADALEAVLRKTQFRRLEIDHAAIDDEGAEAIFDMVEYYESATAVCISGPRQFGIRGWQAASRMIKKSWCVSELEVSSHPLEAGHAPVLARALHTHTCRLRALCLQSASLAGEPLLCLVIALKSNSSVRELRLGDNRLTVSDAAQLGSLLRFNTRLQMLDLSNNQIQDAGAGHIVDALVEQAAQTPPSAATSPLSPHHCPLAGYESRGLAVLVLWNNQLTRNCAPHLSKALRWSQSLCVLNVGRNALGAESVRALQAGGALVSLGLQAARLGPDAARALAELVRADTRLQRLDLRDNKLGCVGLQAILTAMQENSTLTQIDLDDPAESRTLSAEDSEAATAARLTREVRALCRRNEPPPGAASPERRAHRKISLTCHSACLLRGMAGGGGEEERRGAGVATGATGASGRLRSPAPSPAGSPVPGSHHSRFSVTRVTPERESSAEGASPRPAALCGTPSRFKVVQVAEPPQIQIQSTTEPRMSSSRFSVTRNYDSMYNPTLVPSPPPDPGRASSPSRRDEPAPKSSSDKPSIPAVKSVDQIVACDAKNMTKTKTVGDKSYKSVISDVLSDKKSENKTVDLKSDKDCVKTDETHVKSDETQVKNDKDSQSVDKVVRSDKKDIDSDIGEVKKDENVVKSDKKEIKSDKTDVQSSKDPDFRDKVEKVSHSEQVDVVGDDTVLKTETKLVKNTKEASETEKVDMQVEVTVKTESITPAKVHIDQNTCEFKNIDDITVEAKRDDVAMKQIEAITEDLGNLIQEMKDLSTKTAVLTKKDVKFRNDCTQTEVIDVNNKIDTLNNVPANFNRDNVVLKKNKSESSLDSPDLEVSRLMNKKLVGSPFCDSSSSLEISGSSMESLNDNQSKPIIVQESIESDTELDRRKPDHVVLSTENSIESTSEVTPVNSGNFLNMSVSSNESVSPIIFGKSKKIHGSLSSLEASVSSLESARQEKVMVTSADSGIEYSLQNPSENKDDNSSNEGTLTNNSSLKESVKKDSLQETLTSSPKRASSLLDVPALKSKGLDRMRKISWVAPSSSFHIPRHEPEKVEMKLPSHLEKLLSLFQHPSSIFSRSTTEEEKRSASNTPPRKDSSLTSSFWSWGSSTDKEKEDKNEDRDSSEATDSTLSERIQVSFVDESFSKKLDSKTPSTDTENTLSEFQSFPMQGNSETSDVSQDKVTDTTDDNLVQNNLVLSVKSINNASSNGNKERACVIDLMKPNDFNKNLCESNMPAGDTNKNSGEIELDKEDKPEPVRPRSFAAVLKSSGSENSLDKQSSPETGQPVDKLPSKVIRGIKENISPENTLTSSMTNTKTLAIELSERQMKNQPLVSAVWDLTGPLLEKSEIEGAKAPIATIEETCDEVADLIQLDVIDDIKFIDEKNVSADSGVTSLEGTAEEPKKFDVKIVDSITELENIDLGRDALSYLMYENQDFEPDAEQAVNVKEQEGSLAQELIDAENKDKLIDLSPELIIDEAIEVPEVFTAKDVKGLRTSPVIPERAKLKKANSLENIIQSEKESPKTKTIAFKIPESSTARDIPERRTKLRSRSGSSPKSLPESLSKQFPISKLDSVLTKKKKKVSSLGKIARDSLLALNMTEEEIAEFRRSYKLTSFESLKSLESVSEDANSQSGTSVDSRCRSCLRTSQESLISLDSINEDCRCTDDCDKSEKPGRSARF